MSNTLALSQFAEELAKTLPYLIRFSRSMLKGKADPLTEGKITLPQYVGLDLLNTEKLFKMKDIAQKLHISLPAATGLVDRLVKMKMVKRKYNEKDRRVVYITLTSLGKRTVEKIKKGRTKIIEKIFSDLSEGEREIYINIIRKIKRILYEKSEKEQSY